MLKKAKLFSVKVLQEELAPLGHKPDPELGHAPFQLVDWRHEKKFKEKQIQRIKERARAINSGAEAE